MTNRMWKTSTAIGALVLSFFVADFSRVFLQGQTTGTKEKHPRRVLIIRHAEKPPEQDNSVHLTPAGIERAKALHRLFETTEKKSAPFPVPDFIFAAKNSKRSQRSIETVTALSEKLRLSINSHYRNEEFGALVNEIFQNPKYAGKTILICWHHGTTPQLAKQLKAVDAPNFWKATVFDRVWEIGYHKSGKVSFHDRPQRLLTTDSEK
jgi:hypothetical protein